MSSAQHGAEARRRPRSPAPSRRDRRRLAAGGKAHAARRGPAPCTRPTRCRRSSASVIVGQYGPAAAQARTRVRLGIRPIVPPGAAVGTATPTTTARRAASFIRASKVSTNSHYFTDELALRPPYDPAMPERLGRRRRPPPGALLDRAPRRAARRRGAREGGCPARALLVPRLGDAPRSPSHPERSPPRPACRRRRSATTSAGSSRARRRPQGPESRRRPLVPPRPHGEGPRIATAAGPQCWLPSSASNDIWRARPASTSRPCESSDRRCGWRWRSPKRDHAVRRLRWRARPGSRPRPRAGAPARRPVRT